MALFSFTEAILAGKPITLYNNGDMFRDFTYVDDIVEAIYRLISKIPKGGLGYTSPAESRAPYRLYNIGSHNPTSLFNFITLIEEATNKKANIVFLPLQPGDVTKTFADVSDLSEEIDFSPSTPIKVGVTRFVEWYRNFYHC
jgi:UDP-glucuronate 4-epimerase